MSKSSGVVTTRIVLAVVLLSLIVSCVYFFIIKARNDAADADNNIFATYNSLIVAENTTNINDRLGGLEAGEYYSYANANSLTGYKNAYLNLYMSKQLLDANAYRLILSHGDTSAIEQKLGEIESEAKALWNSITVFDTSKEAYGENPDSAKAEAMEINFGKIIKDLVAYSSLYYELASEVFTYTANSYYDEVSNPFNSAQYLYSYCLNKQIAILNKAVVEGVSAVDTNIYAESILVAKQFKSVDDTNYETQTTDTKVKNIISYYTNGENFDDLLNAKNKQEFVQKFTDATRSDKIKEMMNVIGLQGRIS